MHGIYGNTVIQLIFFHVRSGQACGHRTYTIHLFFIRIILYEVFPEKRRIYRLLAVLKVAFVSRTVKRVYGELQFLPVPAGYVLSGAEGVYAREIVTAALGQAHGFCFFAKAYFHRFPLLTAAETDFIAFHPPLAVCGFRKGGKGINEVGVGIVHDQGIHIHIIVNLVFIVLTSILESPYFQVTQEDVKMV